MAKKALLIISSFCIFFYIVSGGSGVDEQQQYTTAASSGESQYTKDLNDMKKKKQRKIQQELGNSDIQKTPTKLVLPPNDEISRDADSQKLNYDTFNNNHDSMNLDESHLGYDQTETQHNTDEQEKYQYSNQFNEFNVDASKSRSGDIDESDRSNNNNNSNDLYRDQSNLSADGEAPPSKEEEDSNNNSQSRSVDNTIGDESYRDEDKSNAFGDTDDRGGGLRGKNKGRSNYRKDSDSQFGRVVTHDGDARRSPDNQMDTTGDRYTSDQTKVLNKRGYDDTYEKKGSSNSDDGEGDNSIVFPKSSDVGDGAFYKHQDQMAIPRLIEPDNNSKSDETSRESTYMKKRRDFQTNVSGDVKKYLQSMNEQSETGKVVVSSDDNSDETKEDEDTTYKKQFHTKEESGDLSKDRYSSVKRRSNTYKHKSVGDEDLYKEQKHINKEVDVSSDDDAEKNDRYSSTKKHMSDTYSKKDRFDEVDSFERQTKKRSHSVEDDYAKSPSASNEDKLTEYHRDNHMQDDSKEKEEMTLSEKKSIVGDNYPGSEEDLKRYASFDKHLLNGIDEVTDNTALGKRKQSTQKQFDDLTAISNKASSLIESDYPEEKHMAKDSGSHSEDEESVKQSNRVKGLDEMNNSSYKKKQTKDVEGTELFYESRTQKEMGSSDDVKASGSGDISQNDKHAQGLEGLNTMTKTRVFNDMTKSNSDNTVNTRYRKPLDDSHVSKKSGSAASRSDDKPDESEYVSSKKSIPSASHVMDKPEEEEYTTKDYSEKQAKSGDEVLSNVDESAYNKDYQRKSHSTDEKESLFDQAVGEQREPIVSGNSGDTSRIKKDYKLGDSRSKKYEEREEKDEVKERDTDILINSDTAPKLEANTFSKKNISLDDKYNDSDKASRLNDRYYGDKKYSTFKQTEGIITADEDIKSKDNENVAMEIGDLAKNRYPATKRRSQSTYKQVEDGRKVDAVSGSSDMKPQLKSKKVMDVEDSNKEARPSGEESKPSVDSKDNKNEDVSKDMSKVSKSADDTEKEMETEEKTALLSRLRKKKTYTESVSGDEKKEKVSESKYSTIESEVKSPLSKLRMKKKTPYPQDASNESGDDTGGVKKDIDSSALGEKNSKSENSNEDATERTDGLISNLQIKSEEEKSGDAKGETERGDGSSQDEPNIVLTAEEESTSIKKKKKRYLDI